MLPSAAPIVRSDFQGSFDVHGFLLSHCQYRTLGDLQEEVLEWELQLQKQLEAVVSENYDELIGSQKGLKAAQEDLSQVKLEVLQFQEATSQSALSLGLERDAVEKAQTNQSQIRQEKKTVQSLIQFLDWLDFLDTTEPQDEQQLVQHSKAVVSLELCVKEYGHAEIVKCNLSRVAVAKQTVLKRINELIKRSPSFELMKAKSWLV